MAAVRPTCYPESHVSLEEYEQTLEELVRSALPGLEGLVIMTPFYLEPNDQDRAPDGRVRTGAKRVAERVGALFVDTQAAFASHFDYVHPTALASDRVHPSLTGHLACARTAGGDRLIGRACEWAPDVNCT